MYCIRYPIKSNVPIDKSCSLVCNIPRNKKIYTYIKRTDLLHQHMYIASLYLFCFPIGPVCILTNTYSCKATRYKELKKKRPDVGTHIAEHWCRICP